jgi:hypothetical protein
MVDRRSVGSLAADSVRPERLVRDGAGSARGRWSARNGAGNGALQVVPKSSLSDFGGVAGDISRAPVRLRPDAEVTVVSG